MDKAPTDKAPTFETDLAALEKLVAELETGELGLDEALKRFETGVKLAGKMQKSLEDTGRRLEKLGADGLTALDLDDDATRRQGGEGPAAQERGGVRKGGRGGSGPASTPTLF